MQLADVTTPMLILQVSNIHELGLVTCSLDSTIKITDLSRCKVLHTVTAHRRGVHCFAHSKAFSLCASGGLERDILLWQGNTNRQVGEMTGHAASISHLAIDNRRCQVQAFCPCICCTTQAKHSDVQQHIQTANLSTMQYSAACLSSAPCLQRSQQHQCLGAAGNMTSKGRALHLCDDMSCLGRKASSGLAHTSCLAEYADAVQVVSMAADNVIKVWDLRNHRCIQTITDLDWPSLEDAHPCVMMYDTARSASLFCLPSNVSWLWPQGKSPK